MVADSDLGSISQQLRIRDYNLPSFHDYNEDLRIRHFLPSQDMIRSVLGLSQSYRKVLDENMNLARHLEIPLLSNTLGKNINALYENPQPHLIETSNACEDNITWFDVADAVYQPEPQEDGSYHLWLPSRSAKVRISQYDHNILLPGNIQRLVHPLSHEPDVQMERDTLALAISEISSWNQLALECMPFETPLFSKLLTILL
jgi:hypothetical protein